MKKKICNLAAAFCIAASALVSCGKENGGGASVVEGLPVGSLKFSLTVPEDDDLVVTRATSEVENSVENLAVLIYDGQNLQTIAYIDEMGSYSGDDAAGLRTYSIVIGEDQLTGVTTGHRYMYAVANYDKGFCTVDMDAVSGMTRDQFLATVVNSNKNLDIRETAVLMSGRYCPAGTDYDSSDGSFDLMDLDDDGEVTLDGIIHLRRIVSKVTFNFAGSKFTPESYTIYNYSSSSLLMEKTGWTKTGGVRNDGQEANTDVTLTSSGHTKLPVTGTSFDFYMLENSQKEVSDVKTQPEREKWDGAEVSDVKDKNFTVAPKNSTWVLVKGVYNGTDEGSATGGTYFGEVSYAIHLGDFSSAGSNGNFTVRRNTHYTYNVTVSGVNKIQVEATTTPSQENQPGAEGFVVNYNEDSYHISLDSHYETALVKMKIPSQKLDGWSLLVTTPKSDEFVMYDATVDKSSADSPFNITKNKMDYGWIRFGKPASTSSFKPYAESETVDVFGLMDELYAVENFYVDGETDHCLIKGSSTGYGYIYTTAYVDEYYYGDLDLSDFVNADDRLMVICLGKGIHRSSDKRSTYAENVLSSIYQHSIKSFSDLSTASNPIGVEQVQETEVTGKEVAMGGTGTSETNGYSNAPALTNAQWNTYVEDTRNGHLVWNDITLEKQDQSRTVLTSSAKTAIYHCITRNRDLNGNGIIDADEIKWFLPASDQCVNLWLGMSSMSREARIPFTSDYGAINNYYTSTSGKQTWWADEGTSLSAADNGAVGGIRCVRALGTYNAATDDLSAYNSGTRTITVKNLDSKSVRTGHIKGEYSPHFRGDEQDKLPDKFQVASADFTLKATASNGTYGDYVGRANIAKILKYNNGDFWRSKNSQNSDGNDPKYIQIDFSVPVNIKNVTIKSDPSGAWKQNRPYKNVLKFSVDGATYSGNYTVHIDENQNMTSVVFSADDSKKYIRSIRLYGPSEKYDHYLRIDWIQFSCTPGLDVLVTNARESLTLTEVQTGDWCERYYSEENNGADIGQWRIPNERELYLMWKWMRNDLSAYTASRSKYNRHDNHSNNFVFYLSGNKGNITTGSQFKDDNGGNLKIRCVRDVQ